MSKHHYGHKDTGGHFVDFPSHSHALKLVSVGPFYPSFLDGILRRSTACRLGGIYYSLEFQHHILHDDFDTVALSVNDHFTL